MTHSVIESDLHDYQNFAYLVANSFFKQTFIYCCWVFVAAFVVEPGHGLWVRELQ